MEWARRLVGIGLIVAACSCAAPSGDVEMTGVVTLDAAPLADGTVVFDPGTGDPPREATVKEGRFAILCPPGSYTVRVFAWRIETLPPDSPGERELRHNTLPRRFNDLSSLRVEAAKGQPPLDIRVSSR